jgi:hypothetical protein
MTKTQNGLDPPEADWHCDLFGICDLLFGIFSQYWPSAYAPCRSNGDCGYR